MNTLQPSETGASSAEYAILIAGIATVIVAVVFLFGGAVHDLFSNSCTSVTNLVGGSC